MKRLVKRVAVVLFAAPIFLGAVSMCHEPKAHVVTAQDEAGAELIGYVCMPRTDASCQWAVYQPK